MNKSPSTAAPEAVVQTIPKNSISQGQPHLPVNMHTGRITQAALAHAIRAVEVMNHEQKVGLADEIFQYQPNLLASILVLPGMGVNMSDVEIALHVLLVAFEAMKRCGHTWPIVSEQVQEMCLQSTD